MLRNHFNLLINVCVYMRVRTHIPYVGNGSLFLLYGHQGSNSGHQVWPQMPLLIEPSGQPLTWTFEYYWKWEDFGTSWRRAEYIFHCNRDKRLWETKFILLFRYVVSPIGKKNLCTKNLSLHLMKFWKLGAVRPSWKKYVNGFGFLKI